MSEAEAAAISVNQQQASEGGDKAPLIGGLIAAVMVVAAGVLVVGLYAHRRGNKKEVPEPDADEPEEYHVEVDVDMHDDALSPTKTEETFLSDGGQLWNTSDNGAANSLPVDPVKAQNSSNSVSVTSVDDDDSIETDTEISPTPSQTMKETLAARRKKHDEEQPPSPPRSDPLPLPSCTSADAVAPEDGASVANRADSSGYAPVATMMETLSSWFGDGAVCRHHLHQG